MMENRHAQFLIAVGELCLAAETGGLMIDIVTSDGASACGVPGAVRPTGSDRQVDDTGFARMFRVDGRIVDLAAVRACTIRAPD
jgi:hypothetical protein